MDSISLVKIILDFLILLGLAAVFLVLKYFVKPFEAGFYCDDHSINLPYKSSTVQNSLLIVISTVLPFFIFLITEVARTVYKRIRDKTCRLNNTYRISIFGKRTIEVAEQVGNILANYSTYLFGLLCTDILTLIGKKTIGRLRPNFLDVCKPNKNVYQVACVSNSYAIPGVHFECTAENKSEVSESRLSFPSGHSSISFYTAIFLILFISSRWNKRSLGFLPQVVQFVLFAMAFFTGLSRVSDNKHHPTDVLAGALLGTVIAAFTFHYLNRFYRRYNYTSPAKYELTNLNEDPNSKELSNLNNKDQKRCSGAKLI